MTAKQEPNILLFVSNRARQILFISATSICAGGFLVLPLRTPLRPQGGGGALTCGFVANEKASFSWPPTKCDPPGAPGAAARLKGDEKHVAGMCARCSGSCFMTGPPEDDSCGEKSG
jgi:hypothetical protein